MPDSPKTPLERAEHRRAYLREWRRRDYQKRVQAKRKPCLPGRTNHRYDPDGLCIHCGAERVR